MSLPNIRREVLFSLAGKNISLTDLRGSTYAGIKILSVEAFTGNLHNTRVTVEVDTWKILDATQWKSERFVERVCLYNRLDLRAIVPQELEIPIYSEETMLTFFKEKGYDFTSDDIYIERGIVVAKDTSLGYYGDLEFNAAYNQPRLITEDRQQLISGNNGIHILLKENGNGN